MELDASALSTMACSTSTAKAAPHAQRQRTTYKARCRGIFIHRLTLNIFAATLEAFGLCKWVVA